MSVLHRTHRSSILSHISSAVFSLFSRNKTNVLSDLMMTPIEAIQELERRQRDPTIRKKVEDYLLGDIPEYFKNGPILYLARHVATPNFETLRFKYLMESLGMKTVVSQDTKDLFVSQNQMKRALCKLSVCCGVSQNNGKLNEQFHNRLFLKFMQQKIENPDDATWIDRHHRGNLLEHYKNLLALFVTHGILFEDYIMEDKHEADFVKNILRPACRFIEQRFGYRQ